MSYLPFPFPFCCILPPPPSPPSCTHLPLPILLRCCPHCDSAHHRVRPPDPPHPPQCASHYPPYNKSLPLIQLRAFAHVPAPPMIPRQQAQPAIKDLSYCPRIITCP
eukprot:767156-Hanusia_phi.AAC.2